MDPKQTMAREKTSLEEVSTVFLVGAYPSGGDKKGAEEHLEELDNLCQTFGIRSVGRMLCPVRKFDAGTYIGKGKLDEILQLVQELQAGGIIFDDEISPNQQKNLENFFQKPVIDRTELIIEVFAQRAQTKEARLQVELAGIKYQFPRLKRMWTHLSRQSSGGGFVKGEGEKQIELDRRIFRKKIDRLKEEIEEVIAQRNTQRIARKRSGIPSFAIVGYTNAGKSTLMKHLTGADVYVENKLFATLDTTTRKFFLPNKQEILLVDTVGFIRKLPHTLIAAFKSTLEEAVHTDIIIHLIDVSHPAAEAQEEAVLSVLRELGADNRPILTVLNKIDVPESSERAEIFRKKYPEAPAVSALTGEGIDALLHTLEKAVAGLRKPVRLRIPQSEYGMVSHLMREGNVLSSEYEENDVLLTVEIPVIQEHLIRSYLVKD